jgi:site-specific recombinase XerD
VNAILPKFLADSGATMKVVNAILGHSQMSTTADIYSHVLPSMRKEAIDLMDKILKSK